MSEKLKPRRNNLTVDSFTFTFRDQTNSRLVHIHIP